MLLVWRRICLYFCVGPSMFRSKVKWIHFLLMRELPAVCWPELSVSFSSWAAELGNSLKLYSPKISSRTFPYSLVVSPAQWALLLRAYGPNWVIWGEFNKETLSSWGQGGRATIRDVEFPRDCDEGDCGHLGLEGARRGRRRQAQDKHGTQKSCGFRDWASSWDPLHGRVMGEQKPWGGRKLASGGDNRTRVQRGRRDAEKEEARGNKVGHCVCVCVWERWRYWDQLAYPSYQRPPFLPRFLVPGSVFHAA